LLPEAPRRLVRTVAVALSLTRIAVLAHWASDVVAGFALGAAVERLLRPWTLTRSFREQVNRRERP
jgi:membrane-associated phospholipid phosphatase